MTLRRVVISPEARADLVALYQSISDSASPTVALDYIERIERRLATLDHAAERGTRRDDVRAGLRIIGFERRMTIAFSVDTTNVTILRIFRRGRNWEPVLTESRDDGD